MKWLLPLLAACSSSSGLVIRITADDAVVEQIVKLEIGVTVGTSLEDFRPYTAEKLGRKLFSVHGGEESVFYSVRSTETIVVVAVAQGKSGALLAKSVATAPAPYTEVSLHLQNGDIDSPDAAGADLADGGCNYTHSNGFDGGTWTDCNLVGSSQKACEVFNAADGGECNPEIPKVCCDPSGWWWSGGQWQFWWCPDGTVKDFQCNVTSHWN
jgi:hypothetical protein